ncbi:hypothetical protein EV183_002994 [Coemansia sp. RSA 2336]|nr:hypothetical protein EV183_002994 [Coemansia sp. RSA 2336]
MFDARHHEMAQLEAKQRTKAPRRTGRNGIKRSPLLRKQPDSKRPLVLNTAV